MGIKRQNIFAGVFVIVVFLLAAAGFYTPASPDGIYYDKGLACGRGYWFFCNSNISIVCDRETNHITTYHKQGNDWVYDATQTDVPPILKPSILGISFFTVSHNRTNTVFIPRKCFSW